MKKLIALTLSLATVCLLSSCRKAETQDTETGNVQETVQTAVSETETFVFEGETLAAVENAEELNILVAYFDVSGDVENSADVIVKTTKGKTFEIKTEKDYSADGNLLKEEIAGNLHPVISDRVENMDSYDAVFLGFPSVEGRLPMAVVSFIEEYDLRDKVLIPFCCCEEGEDLSQVTAQLDTYCFGASQTVLIKITPDGKDSDITNALTKLGF